ncbi:MAG: polysaccharide biosynthesis C-terminal domain-containing protein [Flavobacteriales bacterium]|nr:polysaccharide biosynthesis C-terminal domain-containing protein [Flavobacteriales bacterium]
MQRHFAINIIFLITLNLIIKPFWIFGIDRTIQNTVGSEAYGIYFAIFNFTFLFNGILDLGLSNYNSWSVAKRLETAGIHFKKMASLKLGLGLVYLILTIIIGFLMGYKNVAFELLLILSGSQFLLSYVLFLRSSIAGQQLFWIDSIFSVLDRLLLIIICGILLWTPLLGSEFSIEMLAWGQLAAYGIVILLAHIIFWNHTQLQFGFQAIGFPDIKNLMMKGLPFAAIILFMSMYYRLDAVMLQKLLPDGNYWSGIYAQGYRIFDMLNNFTYLFTAILFPLCTRMISKNENIWPVVQIAIKLLTIPAVLVISLSVFYHHDIIALLYHDISPQSAIVLVILLLAFPLLIFSSIFGTVLTANGNLKDMVALSVTCFILNILANYVFIPEYQSIGAASATLISQGFMAIGTLLLVMKKMSYRPSLQSNGKVIVLCVGVFLNSWICATQDISLILCVSISLPFMVFAILVLKIVEAKEIFALLRSKTSTSYPE